MCVKTFGYCIGEETEIYLALYDSEAGKFLTDRFWIQVTKNSFSNYIDKIQPYCTVFTVSNVIQFINLALQKMSILEAILVEVYFLIL